jgi:hypothetical protein
MTEILGVTVSAARKTGEIGFLIGALGALLLVAGGTRSGSGGMGRSLRLAGSLMIAVGFALGIVYIHWT